VRRILGFDWIAQDDAGEPVGSGEMMVREFGERGSLVDANPRVLPAARCRTYALHVYLTNGPQRTFGPAPAIA
jgi:hypothetical protein